MRPTQHVEDALDTLNAAIQRQRPLFFVFPTFIALADFKKMKVVLAPKSAEWIGGKACTTSFFRRNIIPATVVKKLSRISG